MLNAFEVRTAQGSSLSFSLQNVSSGFIIEDIDGLDPVKATIVSSSFALMDGSQYQSARRESRNIKIRMGLSAKHGSQSVSDLRATLYQYFMPKSSITLRFYLSNGLALNIDGRVESLETVLFAKDSVVDISVICFNPDFYENEPESISSSTTATTVETLVEYSGTTETGFVFTLSVNRTLSEFSIYNRATNNVVQQFDFGAPLIAGDVLTVSTIPGSKGVSLLRNTVLSSMLYGVTLSSSWVYLSPGNNHIRVYATGAAIPFTIEYTNKYGGL